MFGQAGGREAAREGCGGRKGGVQLALTRSRQQVCNTVLFVYAHNKNEIKGSSSGATGKLAAHTHFIEHILSVLDFLNVLYCDQTNKVFNWHTVFSFGLK
uniref:Uncharacterized protein n=2 Tax=Oryza TaxID=4527 RepID=A0A0E0PKB5_ORYRU